MAMQAKNQKLELRDITLKNAPAAPPGARYVLWDTLLPGFGVRVTDRGVKSFFVMRRVKGQEKPVRRTFVARDIKDARETARTYLQDMVVGVDPKEKVEAAIAEKERSKADASRRTASAFGTLFDVYKKRHIASLRPRSAKEAVRPFNNWFLPAWRDRPVPEITRQDVRAVLDKIVDAGAPVAANRASTALKTFFRFCVDRGDLAGSPVEGMRRPGGEERPRDRRLSDDEIRAFWWATDTARPVAKDAKDKPHPVFAPALRAILMTAQRPGEVLGMRWHELEGDDDKAVWRIPSSRSKTHRDQVAPLSKAALAHIRAQPRIGHGPVFTTNGTAPFSGDSKLKPAVDLAMRNWIESNLPADALKTLQAKHGDVLPRWTPHDLRRTARSLMSRAGIRPDIAERVLGHARPTIEETYDVHEYEAEKRDALEKLATLVAEIVAAKPA